MGESARGRGGDSTSFTSNSLLPLLVAGSSTGLISLLVGLVVALNFNGLSPPQ